MSITNFKIRKIEAERERKKLKGSKVDVKSNFSITSIKPDKNPQLGDFLEVRFKFDVTYTPDLGKINLEGELWYYHEKMEEVATVVGTKIELTKEAASEISTTILHESLVEAIGIAKEIRLPVPLRLPKVTLKKETKFDKAS